MRAFVRSACRSTRRERPGLLSVKAPVSGSVIDLQVAPGAFLNDPTAAMMTIANLDTVWVTANVPEKDMSFVFTGQTVNVTFPSYPGQGLQRQGAVRQRRDRARHRRNKVRIAFDNPDKASSPICSPTSASLRHR